MTTFAAWPVSHDLPHVASRAWLSTFSVNSGFVYANTASNALDTTRYIDGAGSIIVTSNVAANCETEVASTSARSLTGKWGFRFYMHDWTKVSVVSLYLSRDTGYSNFVVCILNVAGNPVLQRNGWHQYEFGDGDANLSFTGGTFPLNSTITRWKVRVTALAGQQATISWDAVYYDAVTRPKLLLTADDGYDSWYNTGLPLLDARGLKCTHYLIPSLLGTGGYMTSANVLTAHANGHDVQVHGATNLSTLTPSEIAADIAANQSGLEALIGSRREHYCYPNGVYRLSFEDETIRDILVARGFRTARTVDGITNTTGRFITPYANRFVGGFASSAFNFPELMRIPIIGHEGTYVSDTPENILARIDTCIRLGATCVLMFHRVGSGGTSLDITAADLTTLGDGIARRRDRGLIDVSTVSDWHRGLTTPQALV